jgi:uncharacterized double-CXXCG motif protein
MKIFHFDVTWTPRLQGEMHATHAWCLPGVECPMCGETWANTGLAYPSIDLSEISEADAFTARVVPWEEFERLRRAIEPLARGQVVLPGTELGPLRGSAKGSATSFGAFVSMEAWTVCVRDSTAVALTRAGLRGIRPFDTKIIGPTTVPTILELEVLPRASLAPECLPGGAFPASCKKCGRVPLAAPESIALQRATVPDDVDIFRGSDLTTYVFVTERFVDACSGLEIGNVVFKEVTLL